MTAATTLTSRLRTAVDQASERPMTPEVAERAALCVLDLVGVALAGHSTDTATIARRVGATEFGAGAASGWGSGERLTASGAAFVNGVAGHALDYDDVVFGGGHPSTVVVPAALAVAEELDARGPELLRAVVAGIEAHALLGLVFGPSNYARGFHTTGTLGSFGSAYAAGLLRGLGPVQMASALGLAGTSAAGLKGMFGTMAKPFHAGRAAANGVLAAALAADGFEAAADVLGMEQGFVATQVDSGFDANALAAATRPRVMDVQFKRHAACYLTHASITAIRDLVRSGRIGHSAVERVRIEVPPEHLNVCAIPEPATGLEGKFSLRFTAALALADRSTGIEAYTDAAVADPELVRLRDLVEVAPDATITGAAACVCVRTADGEEISEYRDMSRQPTDGLAGDLRAKFDENVTPILGASAADRLAEAILGLPDGAGVRDIMSLTREQEVAA